MLREGFDVEAINTGWSLDIEESPGPISDNQSPGDVAKSAGLSMTRGAVEVFEDAIRDPSLDTLQATAHESGIKLEISSMDSQSFLATQLEVLDKIRQDTSGMDNSRLAYGRRGSQSFERDENLSSEGRVNEHIGPVQFNMGGIQVDADDMLQRLKVS